MWYLLERQHRAKNEDELLIILFLSFIYQRRFFSSARWFTELERWHLLPRVKPAKQMRLLTFAFMTPKKNSQGVDQSFLVNTSIALAMTMKMFSQR